jgi:hypothetical protein
MRSTFGTIASTSGPLCGGGIEAAPEKTAMAWKILDDRLATNEYLAGKNFTIGDIPLGVWAYRWFKLPIERPPARSPEPLVRRAAKTRRLSEVHHDPDDVERHGTVNLRVLGGGRGLEIVLFDPIAQRLAR